MVNIIKAEHQKAKRTMRKKFIWGFPLLTFAGKKDKILSFNDYSHRQKKIVAGENYLYWVHDFVF